MNTKLKRVYQAFYRQAFIPILVNDNMDAKLQIRACVKAGFKVIEYTQRRPDLEDVLPWIKENYPELLVLIGSTVDNNDIVKSQQRYFPQLLSLDELAAMEVDGFISILKYSSATIKRYRESHLLIPCAATINEAYDLMTDGAHFIKVLGPDLTLIQRLSLSPLFNFCPLFATGGMTLEHIPQAVKAGAAVIASGFDLLLRDKVNPGINSICNILQTYQQAVLDARIKYRQEETNRINRANDSNWLAQLPHYVPGVK